MFVNYSEPFCGWAGKGLGYAEAQKPTTPNPQFDRITQDPNRMNGQPCIRNTRLTVGRVVEAYKTYSNVLDFYRNYPEVDSEDIGQALAFMAAGKTTTVPAPNTQESGVNKSIIVRFSDVYPNGVTVPTGYRALHFGMPGKGSKYLNPDGVLSDGPCYGPRLVVDKIPEAPKTIDEADVREFIKAQEALVKLWAPYVDGKGYLGSAAQAVMDGYNRLITKYPHLAPKK